MSHVQPPNVFAGATASAAVTLYFEMLTTTIGMIIRMLVGDMLRCHENTAVAEESWECRTARS